MAKTNKVIKEHVLYRNLQERYDEMSDFVSGLVEDQKRTEAELRYLTEFIHYKKLEEEYRYFCENAHEEYDEDLPFSRLTL